MRVRAPAVGLAGLWSTHLGRSPTSGPSTVLWIGSVEFGTGTDFQRMAVTVAVKCFITGFATEAGQSQLHPGHRKILSSAAGRGPTCCGGDGWESNPPGTAQHRPTDGFEDRGRHQPPNIPGGLSLPHVARAFFTGLPGASLNSKPALRGRFRSFL